MSAGKDPLHGVTLDVPAGGATSVWARVRKSGTGALELSHTSVIVKRP